MIKLDNELYKKIIPVLSDEYTSIYAVDLIENSILTIFMDARTKRYFGDKFSENISFSDAMEMYIKIFSSDSDKNELIDFCNVTYIQESLKGKKSISKVFLNDRELYCELKLVRMDQGQNPASKIAVIVSYKDDHVKLIQNLSDSNLLIEDLKHELNRQQLDKLGSHGDSALYYLGHDFKNVYVLNLTTGHAVCIRSGYPDVSALSENGESSIDVYAKNWIKNYVIRDDCYRYENVVNLEYLRKTLTLTNDVFVNYRINCDNSTQYFQTKASPIVTDGINTYTVIGDRCIDYEIKDEIWQAEQLSMISSLAEDFDVISYIDIETNIMKHFRFISGSKRDRLIKKFGDWHIEFDYYEQISSLCNDMVHPDDRERFISSTRKENVLKELVKSNAYFVNYRVVDGNDIYYEQMKFTHPGTKSFNLIVGTHKIDEGNSDAQKQLEQSSLIRKLTEDFDCILYLNLVTDKCKVYRVSELYEEYISNWRDEEDYGKRIKNVIDNLILPSDKETFISENSKESVIDNLENTPVYYTNTRFLYNGLIHYIQFKYVYANDKHEDVIVAVHNMDSNMLSERRKSEQMELINHLTNDYDAVYYVDTQNDAASVIRPFPSKYHFNIQNEYVDSFQNDIEFFISNIIIEQDRPRIRQAFKAANVLDAINLNNHYKVEYRVSIEGEILYYQTLVTVDKDNPTKYIVGFKNIDKGFRENLKRHEEEEGNIVKSEFLARMSHDIRTPINGVLGMLEIAEKNINNPVKLKDVLKKVNVASTHLMSLLSDVLDLSRIENNNIKLNMKPMDMRVFDNNCISIILGQLINRDIAFKTQRSEFYSPYVICDNLRLRQIVLNVLENAVKFTPDGGTIYYEITELFNDPEYVTYRFVIEDTGIGMSKDFLARIWDPFSQEDEGARTNYNGTGIGMTITKEYVQMLGGTIEVESQLHVGSKFTITIPLQIDKNPEKIIKPETICKNIKDSRILLVEDNELNMEIAEELLSDQGAYVTEAFNGLDALEKFKASSVGYYDIILMDIMMPEMDGISATKAIRALQRPDAQNIPIIAMTANVYDEDIKRTQEAGMNAHIGKPVNIPTLLKLLSNYIPQKRELDTKIIIKDKE